MASLIGAHFRTNGIKQLPCRAVLSLNGVGLGGDETHPDTITIVRDTRAFPDGEAPPDWRTYDGSDWPAFGQYWYAIHDAYWQLNPADFYQITNEQGGGEGPDVAGNYEQLVKVERAIMQAANANGRKCAVLNLAGGSPGDFEIWKAICAPFIVEAWESGGNLYGRHCYADWFIEDDGSINNGQPQRVINELEYLHSIGYGGGMVLTECGLYGGYGVAAYDYFEQQVTRWEQALRPYADIFIGLCWWECGASEFNADYTAHIKKLLPYIQAGNLPRWTPLAPPPDGGEEPMTKLKSQTYFGTAAWADKKITRLRWQFEHRPEGETGNTYTPFQGEIPLPEDLDLRGIRLLAEYEHEIPDEPTNPNPPPVVLTLPQGSKGVDVSFWQGSFNWADSGAEFGIIRCSDGMTANTTTHDGNGIDRQFFANAAKLTALGIPWAIYHFLRPGSIQAQADKVKAALNVLAADGTPPVTAVFDNGVKLPAVWIDVEDGALTNAHVRDFHDELATAYHTGIYTGKPIWENITAGAAVWWANVPLWIAAYGVNDGNVPPWASGPFLPRGYVEAMVWQYTSNPIDMNIVGPYPPTATQPPPPPPPTGATYSTSFMKAVPNAWRVIQRFDGSGEDIWDLPLGGNRFVRVKNFNEGEWYNGNMRERDTSPAPQTDGTERLYLLNGGAGGQIAPDTAVVGVTYSFTNYVQFKSKMGCADLAENSGTAVSTFLLKEVIDNYTFPSTGFTVDRLFWTVQTGENQLYAIKDGVNIGWVGGGASQDNNVWGGALAELYFDRSIPQQEPPKYC